MISRALSTRLYRLGKCSDKFSLTTVDITSCAFIVHRGRDDPVQFLNRDRIDTSYIERWN